MIKALLIPRPHLSSVYYKGIEPVCDEKWKYQCRYIFDLEIDAYKYPICIETQKVVFDKKDLNIYLSNTIGCIKPYFMGGSNLSIFSTNEVYVTPNFSNDIYIEEQTYSNVELNLTKEASDRLVSEILYRQKIDEIFHAFQSYIFDLDMSSIQSVDAKCVFSFLLSCAYKSITSEYEVRQLNSLSARLFARKLTLDAFNRAKQDAYVKIGSPKFYTAKPALSPDIVRIYSSL